MSKNSIIPFLKNYLINFLTSPFLLDTNEKKRYLYYFREEDLMETFADLILSPTPVLVDVFAEWCMPCKIMTGILKKVKDVQGDSLRIIKIDIDKNLNIAQHYAISSVPTLMIFKNGKQLWRQSGVIEANELNKIIEMFK